MASRITRRSLGMAAVGAAALAQSKNEDPGGYHGALDGLESKVNLSEFNTLDFTRRLYLQAPLRLTFSAGTRQDAEAWQKRLRAKLVELLGGFPERGKAPVAEILETREFPKYRRDKFTFESRPGLAVLGYLLSPNTPGPHAAMVCVPGHGRGVDDIVGIDDKGLDRTGKPGYQHDFAIQAVEHGMAAVAIEPMGFGCRRDPAAVAHGLTQSSCQPAAGAALLLGQTMIAWRAFDVMRTIDWIQTRRDLDPARIGCMGISGGGTCTMFTAALDPRIQVAFVSGYLNTFRDSIFSLSHCIDNYVPGILNWAEQYDIAGLIAPRALFAESGEKDKIFPVSAARESFKRVHRVYETLGAGARLGHEVHPLPHEFWGKQGLPFAAEQLGVRLA